MELEQTPIAISLAPDVRAVIDENGLDLVEALREQGLDVKRSDLPFENSNEHGLKSVELIVLASGAAAPLVASAIARIIDAINRGRKTTVSKTKDEISVADGVSQHSLKVSVLGLSVSMDDKYGGGNP